MTATEEKQTIALIGFLGEDDEVKKALKEYTVWWEPDFKKIPGNHAEPILAAIAPPRSEKRQVLEDQREIPLLGTNVAGFAEQEDAIRQVAASWPACFPVKIAPDATNGDVIDAIKRWIDGWPEKESGRDALLRDCYFGQLVGRCRAMRAVRSQINRLSGRTPAFYKGDAILLVGQTGTGKELAAQEIARRTRKKKPIVVDCSCLSPTLIASELFGHVKGAFTGATANRKGRFRTADGGTLFIDEIGSLALETQGMLLRAIESREVTPLGADTPDKEVDVVVVVAASPSIWEDVIDGRFREDLAHRVSTYCVELPPLRERGDDVLLLALHLTRKFKQERGMATKAFARSAITKLQLERFPGNVRELENRIKRALENEAAVITGAALADELAALHARRATGPPAASREPLFGSGCEPAIEGPMPSATNTDGAPARPDQTLTKDVEMLESSECERLKNWAESRGLDPEPKTDRRCSGICGYDLISSHDALYAQCRKRKGGGWSLRYRKSYRNPALRDASATDIEDLLRKLNDFLSEALRERDQRKVSRQKTGDE